MPVEKDIAPKALTKATTENKIFDNARPEELVRSKALVEEHIVTEALN